jgi:hypothetical protein
MNDKWSILDLTMCKTSLFYRLHYYQVLKLIITLLSGRYKVELRLDFIIHVPVENWNTLIITLLTGCLELFIVLILRAVLFITVECLVQLIFVSKLLMC